MVDLDLVAVAVIMLALGLGGILKGATGAGVPVVAVPVMAAFVDVRVAVAIMVVPNCITNLGQLWAFRGHLLPGRFTWVFAAGGAVGAILGTAMLAALPSESLMLLVAVAVTGYIALRLVMPRFRLDRARADRLAAPVGVLAGVLQGAAGISAPVSLSFLSAMGMARKTFIATVSAFFLALTLTQFPALAVAGFMTPAVTGLGALAILPVLALMPVGAWIAGHMSPRAFDRLVLAFLGALALKLYWDAFV